jgi:hypothetical protein
LLPGKLLLVVAMHPLDESRANQLSRVEPSAGAAHPLTRWGSSKPRAPLEYPIRELSRGRIKNPSQSLGDDSNKSPIASSITTAAPRCLGCRETPKSNKQSQPTRGSSATRCKSLSNALESHSISLEYATKQGDKWRKCSIAQSMPQVFRSARGRPPKPSHHLFIAPRTNMAVTPSLDEFLDRPDVLHHVRSPCAVHVSLRVQHRTSDLNGRLSVSTVKRATGCAAQPTGRAIPGVRFESSKGPLATGRVRSIVTRRALRPIDLANSCPSGRLTGRAGPVSDRTRRCEILARPPLQ